jgi:hypothetical protein
MNMNMTKGADIGMDTDKEIDRNTDEDMDTDMDTDTDVEINNFWTDFMPKNRSVEAF